MIVIKKLDTTNKRATIDIDYEDALVLLNACYNAAKCFNKPDDFNDVYRSVIMLHSLLKHGHIPDFELEQMNELRSSSEEVKKDVQE